MRSVRFGILVASLVALTLRATPAVAEYDHLTGYKAKDTAGLVPPPVNVVDAMNLIAGDLTPRGCEVKKAAYFLSAAEKNAGNDPRGGPTAAFVCFKVKCTGDVEGGYNVDTQFGFPALTFKKTQLLCVPTPSGT